MMGWINGTILIMNIILIILFIIGGCANTTYKITLSDLERERYEAHER
jgi:hypothetical protein